MSIDEARLQQIVGRLHAARFSARPAERATAQEALVADAADLVVEVTRMRAVLERLDEVVRQALHGPTARLSARGRYTGPHGVVAPVGGGGSDPDDGKPR